MTRVWRGFKVAAIALGLLSIAAGGLAWWERAPLLAWYGVRGLARSAEADRGPWVERVVAVGRPAVGRLIAVLAGTDPFACRNAGAGLEALGAGWGPDDPATLDAAQRLARECGQFGPAGRVAALHVLTSWLPAEGPVPAALGVLAGTVLEEAVKFDDPDGQSAGLDLARTLLERGCPGDALPRVRSAVRGLLRAGSTECRLRAVRLSLDERLQLLEGVVPLLQDSDAGVRRAALLAVASHPEVVREDGLLPSLHDADAEIRRLAETALRGRGLTPEQLQLGRLLTDPHPTRRLLVLDHLDSTPDIDPGVWLRRLSHDPSDAVRAAAVRAMSQEMAVDLTDRIDQMARSDPSPTVSQVARFYLKSHRTSGLPR